MRYISQNYQGRGRNQAIQEVEAGAGISSAAVAPGALTLGASSGATGALASFSNLSSHFATNFPCAP